MKCTKCGEPAVVPIRRHNAAFCTEHFFEYFDNQVQRAIKEHRMFTKNDRILVAVSGGKDSLAVWDVLLRLGYEAHGFYIDLGIGEYSKRSTEKVRNFAAERGATLRIVSVEEEYGLGTQELARKVRRPACSACGLNKRYLFNKVALEGGYDVIVTGHNLDDEAATLLSNVLHWNTGYLARQAPVLEATAPNLVKKVKPLFRLTEREIASYCVLRGIDYIVEECPMAKGAKSIQYKHILNQLEELSPGTKAAFFFGFLERGRQHFEEEREQVEIRPCTVCGQPTTTEICAHCRMLQRAGVAVAGA
ncbi:TIGR00269 family protein [Thermaerobacter subterraneus]|uniref:TIGR00269 family protein n=1 Tax=Thermaerobacter subterraneus DSM 13965 TaxID=867903 RepID=K6P1Y4_9FIRM|nr:TIGR00269 family protein [Thermaerobacter subterraneus]EKP95065.1 TIGR00269 family protein [Thermaerobacter subterraneus DSM 13965]